MMMCEDFNARIACEQSEAENLDSHVVLLMMTLMNLIVWLTGVQKILEQTILAKHCWLSVFIMNSRQVM